MLHLKLHPDGAPPADCEADPSALSRLSVASLAGRALVFTCSSSPSSTHWSISGCAFRLGARSFRERQKALDWVWLGCFQGRWLQTARRTDAYPVVAASAPGPRWGHPHPRRLQPDPFMGLAYQVFLDWPHQPLYTSPRPREFCVLTSSKDLQEAVGHVLSGLELTSPSPYLNLSFQHT